MVDYTIISNCNIIDVKTGAIFEGGDIWINKDRILKITPHNKNLTTTVTLIDATNKYVIPGLWDMHAHIVDFDWVPNLYTALGITGIRTMHGGSLIDSVRANRKDGFFRGFEFLYGSPITDGPGENWPGTKVASNPDEGRLLVRDYYEKGYDFVKVYNFLDYETYMAIADECHKLNFPFAGHVPMSLTTKEAIVAGQKSIEHGLGLEHALKNPRFIKKFGDYDSFGHFTFDFMAEYSSELSDNVLENTKSHYTWFCPTLIAIKNSAYQQRYDSIFKNDRRLQYIPEEEQNYWFGDITEEGTPSYLVAEKKYTNALIAEFKLRLSYLKPMLDNGSRFLAGTDTSNPNVYPGFSLHDELKLFVEAGFSELEALQTATLNPAIFVEREDELGTVEEGKIANILILDKNPMENIENTLTIHALVRRGEYLSKTELNKLLTIKNQAQQ